MPRAASVRRFRGHWVTDAGGKRTKIADGSVSKADALRALENHIEKIEGGKALRRRAGIVMGAGDLTVMNVAALFLDHKRKTASAKYLKWLTGYCHWFVKFCGDTKVEKLRSPQGEEFRAFVAGQPTIDSPDVVGHSIYVAKAVLKFAVDSDFILKNPWGGLKKPARRRRRRILTDEVFQKLRAACYTGRGWKGMSKVEVGQVLEDALLLSRATGMRPAEVRLLRWDQVFLERGLIVISEHKTSETTAVSEPRRIAVNDGRDVLERRSSTRGDAIYVFAMNGKPWSEGGWSRRFARLRARAGLDGRDASGEQYCSYHLRHARISEMIFEDKLPMPVVQTAAGHRNIATTAGYFGQSDEDYVRAVDEARKRARLVRAAVVDSPADKRGEEVRG